MAIEDRTNPMQGVSGPGSFSKRTDLKFQSPEYGAGVAYEAAKSGAPLESASGVKTSEAPQVAAGGGSSATITPLYAKSDNDRPITAGLDMGPGPGSSSLAMTQPQGKLSDTLAVLLPYDTTGEISVLYQNALSRGQ
jgi:hypothetical protein